MGFVGDFWIKNNEDSLFILTTGKSLYDLAVDVCVKAVQWNLRYPHLYLTWKKHNPVSLSVLVRLTYKF